MSIPADEKNGLAIDRESDAELVRRVVERDGDALSELYDRFSGVLLALIRRVVGGAGDAEEVLQEVFVQVWRQADRYDPKRSSVSNWLSLISRSRSIDRLRKVRVKERTAQAASVEDPRRDTSPEGARNVLFKERRARIREALGELPKEQRRVIELTFFEGMTQSEISHSTGIPLGTVKTRTLLAMKKLRKALQHELRELL
jgi:RNA polymerase sigma-70 factor (ECF subfamily)